MRLVGGTALALQYGHRQSVDLDFFGTPAANQDELLEMVEKMGPYRLRNRTKNILQLIVNGMVVSAAYVGRDRFLHRQHCLS